MIWALRLFFKEFILLSPLAHGEVQQCLTKGLCPFNGCMKYSNEDGWATVLGYRD